MQCTNVISIGKRKDTGDKGGDTLIEKDIEQKTSPLLLLCVYLSYGVSHITLLLSLYLVLVLCLYYAVNEVRVGVKEYENVLNK